MVLWILQLGCVSEPEEKEMNASPINLNVVITPQEGVLVHDVVFCSATATDPDNDPLALNLIWANANTGVIIGEGTQLELTPEIGTPGDMITCRAIVSDSYGHEIEGVAEIVIENTPPTIESLSIVPERAYNDSELKCLSVSSDPNQSELIHETTWLSKQQVIGTGDSLVLNSDDHLPGDEITCHLTVGDPHGGSIHHLTTTVIENRWPVLEAIQIISNEMVEADSLLRCHSEVFEPDQEQLIERYEWFIGFDKVGEGNTIQLSSSWALPGHILRCDYTATDPHGSVLHASHSVEINNSLPFFSNGPTLSSSMVYSGDFLHCSATVFDLNDGVITPAFEWYDADGVLLSDSSVLAIDPQLHDLGDVITCVVNAIDAHGELLSESTSAEYFNSAPLISGVEIFPAPLTASAPIECIATDVFDPDMDEVEVQYNWFINSTLIHSETLDSQVVSSLLPPFTINDLVRCEATPFDGVVQGLSSFAQDIIGSSLDIYQIQGGFYQGAPFVTLESVVVTGINTSGTTVFVQEIDGGPYSGMMLNIQQGSELALGELLIVSGEVVENPTIGSTRTELQLDGDTQFRVVGTANIEPFELDTNPLDWEIYEGVLIQLNNASIQTAINAFGVCLINEYSIGIDDSLFGYSVNLGDAFDTITGVLDDYSGYRLLPRSLNDFQP